MNRIVTPNGHAAAPQIDAVQVAMAMLIQGRGEFLSPADQAKDICDRIDGLVAEFTRRNKERAEASGGA